MNPQDLQRLYDLLIRQEPYPGDVAPTDRVAIEYLVGLLSPEERERLEAYLTECPDAREEAHGLQEARDWLQRNRSSVLARLAEKAKAAMAPQSHAGLTGEQLTAYVADELPNTNTGENLKRRIEAAVAEDQSLRRRVQELRESLQSAVVLTTAELQSQTPSPAQATLVMLLAALRTLSLSQRRSALRPSPVTYRSGGSPTVVGLVFDRTGKVVLDDEGRPNRVPFQVVRAEISSSGRCLVDLSTTQREVWETPEVCYEALVSLCHESIRLELHPERIRSDGRVVVVDKLDSGVAVDEIPPSVIRVRVVDQHPRPPEPSAVGS